jgi:hypothetical protein
MSKMLVLNPVRGKRRSKSRKAPSAKQKAKWARSARMARARSAKRNPAGAVASYRKRRVSRSTAAVATRRRRRRNPISVGRVFNLRSYMAPLKDAAVMGAGAVAMDVAFGYVNRYLPASMQKVPGQVGIGDAVKAVLTVAIGRLLAGPTRGLSNKAAMGALVVQARDVTMALLPPGMVPSLGWYNPTQVAQMNTRAGLTRNLNAFTQGRTPMLAAFAPAGSQSPILSTQRLRTSARRMG